MKDEGSDQDGCGGACAGSRLRSNFDDEAVEFLRHPDLAAEAAVRFVVFVEFERVHFQPVRRTGGIPPFRGDINVAGRARANAAAITGNAFDIVFGGDFHECADGVLNGDAPAVLLNEGYFRHASFLNSGKETIIFRRIRLPPDFPKTILC